MITIALVAVGFLLALYVLRTLTVTSPATLPVTVSHGATPSVSTSPRHRAPGVADVKAGVTVFVAENRIQSYMATHRRDVYRSTPEVHPELGRGYLVTHYAPIV